jgi:hypothetical protein
MKPDLRKGARARRVERARELKRRGVRVEEIAERMRLSVSTIRNYTTGLGRRRDDEEWIGPLPDLDEDDRPLLEDHMHYSSAIARAPELALNVDGINASNLNVRFARAMRRRGIPTLDPRDPKTRLVAP